MIQLFMLKHTTVLSEFGVRLTIFIFLSGLFFFSTSLTKKKSLFYERAFNVQKKILDDITCL